MLTPFHKFSWVLGDRSGSEDKKRKNPYSVPSNIVGTN